MKRTIGVISIATFLFTGAVQGSKLLFSSQDSNKKTGDSHEVKAVATEKTKPICNGSTVTSNCVSEGINYATFVYHPAVPEKSHEETVTTYKKEVSGYCTLCEDGTYSPSCATGRGACSHHGGVAEWNAPRYTSVPVHTTNKVIDTPAQEAYYDKVAE